MTDSAGQDLQPDEAQPEVPVIKKATQQTKNRGAHTTVAKRAQFEDLEVRLLVFLLQCYHQCDG